MRYSASLDPAGRFRSLVRRLVPAACLLCLACGCTHLGAGSIQLDRISYSNVLADSWKREVLLNIVRIRYLDPPVFLNISSLVNGYTRRGEAHAGLNPYDISGSLDIGGNISLEERPTVSYSPPTSTAFSAMLTPIEPVIPLTLIESGWDAALVLRMTVRTINGVRNARNAWSDHGKGSEYDRVLKLVETIQKGDALRMELRAGEKKGEFSQVMFLPVENPSPEISDAIAELRKLLKLHPGVQEYRVVRNSIGQSDDKTLVLQTRSVMHMLTEFASCIDVPAADIETGVVFPGSRGKGRPLVRIHSGRQAPEKTYAKVKYDDTWFWIDRDDYDSKLHFIYMLMILRASARDEASGAPVLTIPTS